MSQQTEDQLFPIRNTKTYEKKKLNPSTLLSFAHIQRKITIYKACLLCLKALNLNTESVSAGLSLSLFSTAKQDVSQMLAIVQSSVHRALC